MGAVKFSADEVASPMPAAGYKTAQTCTTALVTGSSGLCGARIVEMLLERGTKKVVAFDIVSPSHALQQRFDKVQANTGGKIVVVRNGDLASSAAVDQAFKQHFPIQVVFHVGALVGPFHDKEKYYQVNYLGTLHILDSCRKYNVPKLVYSSSPSTRFTGADITGQREEELPIATKFLARYAETKAQGEQEVSKACCSELMTTSVAPHQVYGPHDNLFLPSLLEAAGNGQLRIFGNGRSLISTCHVDNYSHGCLCGADALFPDSPALGKFYIVTDGRAVSFWKIINEAVVAMGFTDLESKVHLPVWLLYGIAYFLQWISILFFAGRRHFKLNPFNVKMLTMHRWFSIENARRDLRYEPLIDFTTGWAETIAWFKINWLPSYLENKQKRKVS